jgi:hypothetical protein
MRKQGYVALIFTFCLISWLIWVLVIFFVGPEDLGILSVVLFLLIAGLVFFTSFLLFFYYLRIRLLKLSPGYRQFHIIFRESLLVSILLIIVMLLSRNGFLNLFNVLALIILFFLIDIFFVINYDQKRPQKNKSNSKAGRNKIRQG